jgi:hypothetical protein
MIILHLAANLLANYCNIVSCSKTLVLSIIQAYILGFQYKLNKGPECLTIEFQFFSILKIRGKPVYTIGY